MKIRLGLTISFLSIGIFSSQIKTGKKIRTVQFEKKIDRTIGSVRKKTTNKITTKKCNEFPYEVGCKNNDILELQKCLGLKQDGVLGARTIKMLKDYGNDLPDDKLTFDVWGNIILSCGEDNNNGLVNINSENRQGVDLSDGYGNADVADSPNKFYKDLMRKGYIDTVFSPDGTDSLIRYIGVKLSDDELEKLDTALRGKNFTRTEEPTISATYLYKRITK